MRHITIVDGELSRKIDAALKARRLELTKTENHRENIGVSASMALAMELNDEDVRAEKRISKWR